MGEASEGDRPTGLEGAGRPTPDQVRAAVERNPRQMTLQLARDLGVPEAEVIRALPAGRAVELDSSRWEDVFRAFEPLGPVRVLVSNGATTVEVVGRFGGFSTTGGFFNVQTDTLDLHIRWRELGAVFAVEKPGHMDGSATHSVQFYDRAGAAALKVFVTFGGPADPDRVRQFTGIRDAFGRPEAAGQAR